MERRRVPLDWDALETALTWRNEGVEYFLDVTTGQVAGSQGEDLAEGSASGRLVRVDRLPSSIEHDWMSEFTAGIKNPDFRDALGAALRGSGAFRRFKDVLDGHRVQRERWLAFRRERLSQVLRDWLEANEIEPTTEPRRLP